MFHSPAAAACVLKVFPYRPARLFVLALGSKSGHSIINPESASTQDADMERMLVMRPLEADASSRCSLFQKEMLKLTLSGPAEALLIVLSRNQCYNGCC